jgi:prepilin-type N-terminal cleavage/methylation domain-containing protein/prepilin-type processing-associated H-X9-DG protein
MTMRGQAQGRTRRGFTLVELLVVVTIIVLMLSLMLPSFSRALDAATISVCADNLRQISTATSNFGSDNFMQYPLTYTFAESRGGDWDSWETDGAGYTGIVPGPGYAGGQLWPYLPREDCYICPDYPGFLARIPGSRKPACSYVMHESVQTGWQNFSIKSMTVTQYYDGATWVPLNSVANLMIYGEESLWLTNYGLYTRNNTAVGIVRSHSQPFIDSLAGWHKAPDPALIDGQSNVGFADGHVGLHHPSESTSVAYPAGSDLP